MPSDKRPVVLTTAAEKNRINRQVLIWLNTFPDLPVDMIRYEPELEADAEGMALSTIQGGYIVDQDILGNYTAEYQFKVLYRIKPGNSMDKRLQADELLDRLGDWAVENPPEIDGITDIEVRIASRSALFGVYEDGDEDHQIMMAMQYFVQSA